MIPQAKNKAKINLREAIVKEFKNKMVSKVSLQTKLMLLLLEQRKSRNFCLTLV